MLELEEVLDYQMSIKIVGIGRKGAKAVSKMTHCIENVEFLFVAKDQADVVGISAHNRIFSLDFVALDCAVGSDITGSAPPKEDSIADAVRDTDLVFIVTGLENQAVADLVSRFTQEAREAGVFTIAVTAGVSGWNGAVSGLEGVAGLHQCSSSADSVLVLANDSLVPLHDGVPGIFTESALADYLVRHAVGQIVQCLTEQGMICLDFADIKTIFGDGDRTYMGIGLANGPTKGKDALLKAVRGLSQQGLDITQAIGLLTIVEGSTNMTMEEFDEVSRALVEIIPDDMNILFGCFFDDALGENMRVTVFTSFQHGGTQENAAL